MVNFIQIFPYQTAKGFCMTQNKIMSQIKRVSSFDCMKELTLQFWLSTSVFSETYLPTLSNC